MQTKLRMMTEEERESNIKEMIIEQRKSNFWRGFRASLLCTLPIIAVLVYLTYKLVMVTV
jgi:hypothetical protein